MGKFKISLIIFLAMAISLSGSYAGLKNSLELEESFVLAKDWKEARSDIESNGGRIRHIFPDDNVLIGDVPINFKSKNIKKIYDRNSVVPSRIESVFVSWTRMLDYNDLPLEEKLANIPDVEPIYDDMIMIEKPSLDQLTIIPRDLPEGASLTDTSSFMIGDVVVGVIFPESNDAVCIDLPECTEFGPDQEDWTDEEIIEVKAEIMNSMNWWIDKEPLAHLTFIYDYEERTPTDYEPIWGPGTSSNVGRCFWINDNMVHLGYGPAQTDCTPLVFEYVNGLREEYEKEWAFNIFVVDSSDDFDGKFDYDESFAFTVIHEDGSGSGPYLIMTYDNGNYGITNMDTVSAHETGHIFGALDEYGSCSCDDRYGYLYYENQNCVNSCLLNENSIMGNGNIITAFANGLVDLYARGQIGWQNTDEDNILDIEDTIPNIWLNQYIPIEDDFYFDGESWVNFFHTLNPYYNNITINTIANVEYRYQPEGQDWTGWFSANATDDIFDSAQELYEFILENLPGGNYAIQSRSINNVGNPTMEGEYGESSIVVTSLPPYCEDSDGGFNIWERGTLIDDYGEYTDECFGQDLLEWFCGEDGTDASEVYCLYGCSLGRCMEKSYPLIRFMEYWPGHDDPL